MHIKEGNLTLCSGKFVNYRFWQPSGDAHIGKAILLLHGIESHSGWFADLAPFLVDQGFAVYAPDRIGWGASPGTRGHLSSYNHLLELVDSFANHLREAHGEIHLAGLSWGGKMALYCALRRPHLFSTLTLIAPGLVSQKKPSWLQKAKIALSFFAGQPKHSIALPIADGEFTRNPSRAGYIRADGKRVKSVTAAFCVENLKMDRFIAEHIGQLRIPAQLLLAGDDAIINNTATAKLFASAGHHAVRTLTHEHAAHSLVFETPERTAQDIAEFSAGHPHTILDQPRRIAVMGAGAVGSTVGALLALGGHDVTLIARGSHAEAVNSSGLKLTLGQSVYRVKQNLRAVTSAADLPCPPDIVLLCVKSFDTVEACRQLASVIAPETVILSLQNGLGNDGLIAEALPKNMTLTGGICGYLSFDAPGAVRLASDLGGIALGQPEDGDRRKAVADLRAVLSDTGLEITIPGSEQQVKWSKLMLNVAFNALSALTGLGTAEIMNHRRLGPLAVATFAECARVMRTLGIEPVNLPGYPTARLAKVMRLPVFIARRLVAWSSRKEAKGLSSMAQDVMRQRGKSEIDEINGEVARAGEMLKIPTPVNLHLVETLGKALADSALLEKFRANPASVADGWR